MPTISMKFTIQYVRLAKFTKFNNTCIQIITFSLNKSQVNGAAYSIAWHT